MRDKGSAALRLAGALAVLGAAYVALAVFVGRHVPSDTTVAGVPIGGMTPVAARTTLQRELAPRAAAKVTVRAADRAIQLDPATAGLALDLPATVDRLTGFTLDPRALWQHLAGGQAEPLRTEVDRPALEAALGSAGKTLEVPVKEGSITFPAGKVAVTAPVPGSRLSVGPTADVVEERWPVRGPVTARLDTTVPKVSAEEVQRATEEFARPAVSGPVTVVVGAKRFDIQPAAFAPALAVRADARGRLAPDVDGARLVAAVRKAAVAVGVETRARDARIVFRGTEPVVVPSAVGATLDDRSVVAAFVPALTARDRTAKVATAVVQPQLTTAQAEKIKPKEVISTFTTTLPYNPPRTENITIAARTLNGTYVAPGKQFSLNAVLGQRTAAKGYNQAPVILDGRLTKDFGGGISQLSTTTFNAAFFSGVRIDQYLPHSFYISRYPEGREATVSWPDVDQKWTNDTGYGILVQAGVSGNEVTVTFHGTKVWDIEALKGPRRNVVQPKDITDDKPGCVPQTPTPGFDVTVTRVFKRHGAEVKRSTFTTHYIPEDNVRCTHPAAG